MNHGDPQGAWPGARKRDESPTKGLRICTGIYTKGMSWSGGRYRLGAGKCHSRHVLLCDCRGGGESLSADRYDEDALVTWIIQG